MVFLIVATEIKDAKYFTGKEWVSPEEGTMKQIVIDMLVADDYEDALDEAHSKYGIDYDHFEAFALAE